MCTFIRLNQLELSLGDCEVKVPDMRQCHDMVKHMKLQNMMLINSKQQVLELLTRKYVTKVYIQIFCRCCYTIYMCAIYCFWFPCHARSVFRKELLGTISILHDIKKLEKYANIPISQGRCHHCTHLPAFCMLWADHCLCHLLPTCLAFCLRYLSDCLITQQRRPLCT